MVSVLAVLKSPRVDVEDFDRVVGAGAGQLEPGALPLAFTPHVSPSVSPVAISTCSTGPGPPAEPLHRQSVALSVGGRVMKGDNGGAALEEDEDGNDGDMKTTPVSASGAAVQSPSHTLRTQYQSN